MMTLATISQNSSICIIQITGSTQVVAWSTIISTCLWLWFWFCCCRYWSAIFVTISGCRFIVISSIDKVQCTNRRWQISRGIGQIVLVWHMQLLDLNEHLAVGLIERHYAGVVTHDFCQFFWVLRLDRCNDAWQELKLTTNFELWVLECVVFQRVLCPL